MTNKKAVLMEAQLKIMELMIEYPEMTSRDMAKRVFVHEQTVAKMRKKILLAAKSITERNNQKVEQALQEKQPIFTTILQRFGV